MTTPTYLILGATGGMGQALCERLSERGASLLIGGRDAGRLEELSKRTGAELLAGDARDPLAVERAVARTVDRFGRIDGAVNLVGSLLLKPAHLTRPEEWNDVVATNLGTAFHLVRAAAKQMRGPGGSIVLVSSAAAQTGLVNHEAIAAAKAGVEGLARSAAATYAAQGVRVNCVAPGLVRTPLTERLNRTPAGLAASEAMHPLGRIGDPEDVASAIDWLLDPVNTWVSGQVLGIDGGLAKLRGKVRV
jgi:NAD(P)-dependent dehydrogenase (short-subunit alcohol dehydrogenase family)